MRAKSVFGLVAATNLSNTCADAALAVRQAARGRKARRR